MIIKKIYNNNIAMVCNENGDEVILVGKGIAFGLKKGDEISENCADKKFELKGETRHKFERMILETPIDYIIVSEEIIAYIKEHSTKEIDDGIYVTLTDHISNTVERIRMGIDFDMTMLLNVKLLYRDEYKLALHSIDIMRKRFDIKIDDNEANFITLHIVNAQTNSNMMLTYSITEIINGITGIVIKNFDINTKDNMKWDRFITHCRFFVQRIINKESLNGNIAENILAYQNIHDSYSKQYDCLTEICEYINKKYSHLVNKDEKMYLLIHLISLTDKLNK
ncbi:MAG: PRD domain-containing protein [Longicatena sp.]